MSRDSSSTARVVLVLLAVGLAAYGVSQVVGARGRTADDSTAKPAPPAPPEGGVAFDPNRLDSPGGEGSATPPPPPVAPPVDEQMTRLPGTPVGEGAEVDVRVPYRTGTESEYRVSHSTRLEELQQGIVSAQREIRTVRLRVVEADGTGDTRIREEPQGFRIQNVTGASYVLEFNSESPDELTLADPNHAIWLKPKLAEFTLPLTVTLDAKGNAVDVDGVEEKDAAWRAALELISAQSAREAQGPNAADELDSRREWFFPPVGGGTLRAGETRPVQIRRNTGYRCWIAYPGTLRVTHDDPDAFTVELTATPTVAKREARNATEEAIHDVRVVASKDAYRASWRFDRETGRLVGTRIEDKYRLDVAWRVGGGIGDQQYERKNILTETRIEVDLQ